MFESFKSFIAEFVDGEKHPDQFAEDDYRLAAAAMLVHAAAIDGEMSQSERDKLHAVIKQRFALDDATTDELITKATAAEHEAVDLYHFTHLLNRALDEDGRAKIVEMMWEIVYADGQRDELEDNLVWRAADLLGVSASASRCAAASVATRETGHAHHRRLGRHRRGTGARFCETRP
jgi:uncharacterized tellurite resistance protein B-like protein